MAGETGLEPATFGVTSRCSNQLRYSPRERGPYRFAVVVQAKKNTALGTVCEGVKSEPCNVQPKKSSLTAKYAKHAKTTNATFANDLAGHILVQLILLGYFA